MSFDFDPDVQAQLMKQMVPCPICSQKFTLLEIEAHSDVCLENSFKAKPVVAQPRPVVVASRPGQPKPVAQPRKPVAVMPMSGDEKSAMVHGSGVDMDPELDFDSTIEQVKMQVKYMGNVNSEQVLKMLDGLRRKYAQEKDEPEWVKITYDDTAEDIGGKPEFINKHELDNMH
jgi:hypothetical protein